MEKKVLIRDELYVFGAETYVSSAEIHVFGARTYVLGAEI